MMWRVLVLVFGVIGLGIEQVEAIDNGQALTPPMGFNTYNAFLRAYNETILRPNVDLMVSLGLVDAGYNYFNIDGLWWNGDHEQGIVYRNDSGHFVEPTEKFPSGMRAMSDYVHNKGLKFGMYTSARTTACCCAPKFMRPMSQNNEEKDFELFYKDWKIDFLKVDNCGRDNGLSKERAITRWKELVEPTEVVLENARIGCLAKTTKRGPVNPRKQKIPKYCSETSHMWRISRDIGVYNDGDQLDGIRTASWNSIMFNAMTVRGLEDLAGPGHWNHLDMLDVGNGLPLEQEQAHFALWSITSSPLIFGTDLRDISPDSLQLLLNADAISVNHEWDGDAGRWMYDDNKVQFWSKRLPNKRLAILFVNAFEKNTRTINVDFSNTRDKRLRELIAHIQPEEGWQGKDTHEQYLSCQFKDIWSGETTTEDREITRDVDPRTGQFYLVSDCTQPSKSNVGDGGDDPVPCENFRKSCEDGSFRNRKQCRGTRWRRRYCQWCGGDVNSCRAKHEDSCSNPDLFSHCRA